MTYPLLDHGPVLTVETLATIVELTDDGLTVREIADRLGINHWTVQRGRTITGVAKPVHDGTPQDVDEMAVLRATWGEDVDLNVTERREAIARLSAQGVSTVEIARKLRVTTRTVTRHRAKVAA